MKTMETMNNNIQEQRVSFDNAKRLKEKGFDVECNSYYSTIFTDSNKAIKTPDYEKNSRCASYAFIAPTQQLALDWILVNFKLHVRIDWFNTYDDSIGWDYSIQVALGIDFDDNGNPAYLRAYDPEISFKTPEEAKEAAISFVLTKLI